jgi:glycosyltransferase involved in cell wall biosynthesis
LALAAERPDCLFLVYGGDIDTVARLKRTVTSQNLRFSGHIPHPRALQTMRSVDVLLMPYQTQVSIGVDGHDTGQWMSPMKMFEYMSTGVPIISSDLPVLREVLVHGKNCLFAVPDDPASWTAALDQLNEDPALAARIGKTAYKDYDGEYTWLKRARRIIAFASDT